jgi:hypothetical protein
VLNLARYVAKHLTCRVEQELDGPLAIDEELTVFLDGGNYPMWLSLDFRLEESLRQPTGAPGAADRSAKPQPWSFFVVT